jgi:hypothetical protein
VHRSDPEIEPMYPSSTPLVPDDQYHERDFAPRDLDAERDLQRMRRPQHQTAMKKPSLANRMVRSVSRFFAAILIGVALTLAGQSYSEQLNEMIAGWAPSLASLLPAQSSKQTAEGAASSEVAQQVKLIAVDLAIVRRSMGQLAANQDQFAARQEQMNQNIVTLQQAEQEVRQQILAPPAPKAAHPPAPAAHSPPQPSPR